jgi:phosphopantothenoylcysteine decarboxylase/phosphopantothenate--cysteine ligase
MVMHPADDLRGVTDTILSHKRIVLGITGSIAAVECVKLAREFIRHGAEVIPVMTPSATRILHPDAMEFATGNPPVVELTGKTEHVTYCGRIPDPVDLLLISPCTANTLSKIVHGIDDTPVTTFASTALGTGIPVVIVPAMHLSMYDHQVLQENIRQCRKLGIHIIEPLIEQNKAKLPDQDSITAYVIKTIGPRDIIEKSILIIGGATAEPIDDIRIITNRSSGKTAIALARNAFLRAAKKVELWYGKSPEPVPSYVDTRKFESYDDLHRLLQETDLSKFDCIILCASITDYLPEKQKGKIPSGQDHLSLTFSPAQKLISLLRKKAPTATLIGFKVEASKEELHQKAYTLLKKNDLNYVVANTVAAFGTSTSAILIVDASNKTEEFQGTKQDLANHILDLLT